ncbi:MAG: cytochrome o ubiquinol oxidase subunit III [Phenylobacterium sp.]|nr:MAG: cytochrome o ubiquinol oxidase subunit III [Phenylobacterium sp.]
MSNVSIATAGERAPARYQPATKLGVTGFGFYVYLLSDAILFSALFATFAVLKTATDGGPTARDLFDLKNVGLETACLLTSSFVCGLAMQAAEARKPRELAVLLGVVFVLGASFLTLEIHEFGGMIAAGAGPDRSAFLSAFFALVGAHGLHITVGLIWIGSLLVHIMTMGFSEAYQRRLFCFSLFWHVLDVVWIAIFTFVYLLGVQP